MTEKDATIRIINKVINMAKKIEDDNKKETIQYAKEIHKPADQVMIGEDLSPVADYLHQLHEPLRKIGILSGYDVQLRLARYVRHYVWKYTKLWDADYLDRASNALRQLEEVACVQGPDSVFYKFRINPRHYHGPNSIMAFELIDHLKKAKQSLKQNK